MENSFTGKNMAFTGIVNGMLPQTMEGILKLIGANATTIIQNNTDCLIVGKEPDVKLLSQAFLKNIKVLTGEEFAQMLAL